MAFPREVKVKIADCYFDTPILLLGKAGENLATKVIIDASEWQNESGTYQLLVKRADEEMFTATIEQTTDGVVTWLIPAAEIGAAGYGEIELNYLVGEAKIKSARVDTRVFSSIEIDSLPPNGTTWSQLILAAIQDAHNAAADAEKTKDEVEKDLAEAVAYATAAAESAAQSAADEAHRAENIANSVETALDDAVTSATKAAAESAMAASKFALSASDLAKNAASSAATATSKATEAINAKTAAEKARDEARAAQDKIFDILCNATILDTTETVTFNDDDLVDTIVHIDNGTGGIIRTDKFTYNGDVVTEIRTAADGKTQTNIYDLGTLSQQFNV